MTPQELAEKFIRAGYADDGLNWQDLTIIGITKSQKTFNEIDSFAQRRVKTDTWSGFCQFVYQKVTEKAMPSCPLRGKGFRSQWYGKRVAEAIVEKYGESDE